jgi:hypothetical protein
MLRKTALAFLTVLAVTASAPLDNAFARDAGGNRGGAGGNGGAHGDDFYLPPVGGGGQSGGGFDGRSLGGLSNHNFGGNFGARRFGGDRIAGQAHHWNEHRHGRRNWNPEFMWGFESFPDYGYDCYRPQRYHTRTGWHIRRVYVC